MVRTVPPCTSFMKCVYKVLTEFPGAVAHTLAPALGGSGMIAIVQMQLQLHVDSRAIGATQ